MFISFEIYDQNSVKKATIQDYLANFVITINTLISLINVEVGINVEGDAKLTKSKSGEVGILQLYLNS